MKSINPSFQEVFAMFEQELPVVSGSNQTSLILRPFGDPKLDVTMATPRIQSFGDLVAGRLTRGASSTPYFAYPMLISEAAINGGPCTPSDVATSDIVLLNYWWQLSYTLRQFLAKVYKTSQVSFSQGIVQSILNAELKRMHSGYVPIASENDWLVNAASVELLYSARGMPSQFQDVQDLPSDFMTLILKAVSELGCNPFHTSKSKAFRRIGSPGSKTANRFLMIPNVLPQHRTFREFRSLGPNSQPFTSASYSKSLVETPYGELHANVNVKHIPIGIVSFEENCYVKPDGSLKDLDMIYVCPFAAEHLAVNIVKSIVIADDGETDPQVVFEAIRENDPNATMEEVFLPMGSGCVKNTTIKYILKNSGHSVQKTVVSSTIKGLLMPLRAQYYAQREGETFYRPLYMLVSPLSFQAKDAAGLVLPMLMSHLPKEERILPVVTSENFQEIYDGVVSKLPNKGFSKIYRDGPGEVNEIEILYKDPVTDNNYLINHKTSLEYVGESIEGILPTSVTADNEHWGQLSRGGDTNKPIQHQPLTLVASGEVVPLNETDKSLVDFYQSLVTLS